MMQHPTLPAKIKQVTGERKISALPRTVTSICEETRFSVFQCECQSNSRQTPFTPGGGEIFRTSPDRSWGPPSLLYNGYRVFPGGKVRPGRDADPSPPSSAEVKNRVELYLYSP